MRSDWLRIRGVLIGQKFEAFWLVKNLNHSNWSKIQSALIGPDWFKIWIGPIGQNFKRFNRSKTQSVLTGWKFKAL